MKQEILEILDDSGNSEFYDLLCKLMISNCTKRISLNQFEKALDELARAERIQIVENDEERRVCLYGQLAEAD